jgi:hypothetical protein
MTAAVYSEFRHWSPVMGCAAVRLSMADDRGAEFFMMLPVKGDRPYRERRDEALATIMEAIRLGCEPGEVHTEG